VLRVFDVISILSYKSSNLFSPVASILYAISIFILYLKSFSFYRNRMTLKVKKGSGDINIRIETNIFSKNKDKDKPKPKKGLGSGDGGANGLVESYSVKNPYEPEPSFLSEIKTAMSERNFYGMKFNPRPSIMPPTYNNWYDTHSRSLQIEEIDDDENDKYVNRSRQFIDYEDEDEDETPNIQPEEAPDAPDVQPEEEPDVPNVQPVAPNVSPSGVVFDKNGKYLGKRETKEEKRVYAYHKKQRDNYTNGRVQPRKANVIKYGLQEYFG
jgi:hypothetical protein